MGHSRSIHHLFNFTLGSAVVGKPAHRIMNLVILCHSLDDEPVLWLSRPPCRVRIHHRDLPSRLRDVFIRRYSYGNYLDIGQRNSASGTLLRQIFISLVLWTASETLLSKTETLIQRPAQSHYRQGMCGKGIIIHTTNLYTGSFK